MRPVIPCFLLLALLALAPAQGQRLYVGGGAGQAGAVASYDDPDFGNLELDDDDLGYRLFVGAGLGPLAIEAGYRDFGEIEGRVAGIPLRSSTDGFDAFVVGRLKISRLSLFAKLGGLVWETDFDVDELDLDGDGTSIAWGVGVGFRFTERLELRAEYEGFDVDLPDDLEMISLAVTFKLF